jgi:hypothetical protein
MMPSEPRPPAGEALSAWLRDLRVLFIALLIAAPVVVVLPALFPGRATDDTQRLLDALVFAAVIAVALWIARRLVGAWDARHSPRDEP